LNVGTFQLRIASTIQPGYLQHSTIQNFRQSNQTNTTTNGIINLPFFTMNHSNSTNNNNHPIDFNWIDNGKYLFKIDMKPFSSIYTHDAILSKFFHVCNNLLPRMLFLSSVKTNSADKLKQNRVTFRDDAVVIQSNHADLSPASALPPSSTTATSTKRVSFTNGTNSILHNNNHTTTTTPTATTTTTTTNTSMHHLHLCNAMKTLLLISPTGLVQFLPVILNQFMEIIILSAETSARCFQQQQQTTQSSSGSIGNNDEHRTIGVNHVEYAWFKSLINNSNNNNNNVIGRNATANSATTTITNNSSSNSNNNTPDDVLRTAIA
ncbi:unnamed protein product, partial [Schistosoma turkestanicum]